MTTETIEQRAERLVRQEVLCCMSHIVATLANGAYALPTRHSGMTDGVDELGNLAEQAAELAAPIDDWEEAAIQEGWRTKKEGFYEGPYVNDKLNISTLATSWEDLCHHHKIGPYQREVFEHWAVTDWLADQLIEHGEKVDKDFGALCVWARCTTGQSIASDGVIERIAKECLA